MPTNEDRLWDVAICEAVTGRQPPDLLAIILARSIEPARAALPRPRWQRITWRALQLSAAAGVLLAIGLLTGLVKWPADTPGETPEARNMIAAPGAKWRLEGGMIALESGALLLSTGAPEVRCGDSKFAMIDGLAMVQAGRELTPEEQATLKAWLETKGVEAEMIRNATKWLQGAAMAVLMLQGSATLDGQKVEAEKPAEKAAKPVWHRVSNVMDIDKLPSSATHVNADGLKCAHIDFIAEVQSLTALTFRQGSGMKKEHLVALAKLPNLVSLDLTGTNWAETPDYSALSTMKSLAHLAVDPFPDSDTGDANVDANLHCLKELSAKRVGIVLGAFDAHENALKTIVETLPNLAGLAVRGATDDDLKLISRMPSLTTLSVTGPFTDIGLAYLARSARLKNLTCELAPDTAQWFQVGRMKQLEALTIDAEAVGDDNDLFGQLAALKELSDLDLSLSTLSVQPKTFKALPQVARLRLSGRRTEQIWDALVSARARQAELLFGTFSVSDIYLQVEETATNESIETLTIVSDDLAEVNPDDSLENVTNVLSRFVKLKRVEVRRVPGTAQTRVDGTLAQLRKAAPKLAVEYVP